MWRSKRENEEEAGRAHIRQMRRCHRCDRQKVRRMGDLCKPCKKAIARGEKF